jgi:putative addiction module component (TIGR02574 family)
MTRQPAGLAQSVEQAWRQEVAARVARLDAGEVKTIPWSEIRDQLFARLQERRPPDLPPADPV